MTADNESLGMISKDGDRAKAVLRRTLEHSIEDVWSVLTDPAKFVDWLAPGEIELYIDGKARLDFVDSGIVIDSRVSQFVENQVLEYSWSGPGEPLRPITWELKQQEAGTLLTLTLESPADEDFARSCAGWEAHLMMLIAALEGVPIKFPFERFQITRDLYNELF